MIPGQLRFSEHSASVGSLCLLLSQNERVKYIILYLFFFFPLYFSGVFCLFDFFFYFSIYLFFLFLLGRLCLEVSQGLNLSPHLITFGVFPSLQQFCLSSPGTGVALRIHQWFAAYSTLSHKCWGKQFFARIKWCSIFVCSLKSC